MGVNRHTRRIPHIPAACTRFTGLAEALHRATVVRQDRSEAPRKKDGMFGLVKRMGQRTEVSLLALLLAGATFLAAQQAPPADVKQVVRDMIDNELHNSHRGETRWMYRLRRQEGDTATLKEVVETKICDVNFLLSLNGKPLTPDQRQKENERLERLERSRRTAQGKARATGGRSQGS